MNSRNFNLIIVGRSPLVIFFPTPSQPPEDALFAHPRLFRACVPPGMHRFRGNIWDYESRPQVMRALGYPLKMEDRIPDITKARNIELGLGLQVVLLLPIILLFLFLLKTTYCYHLLIVAFVVVSRKVRKENYVNSKG